MDVQEVTLIMNIQNYTGGDPKGLLVFKVSYVHILCYENDNKWLHWREIL